MRTRSRTSELVDRRAVNSFSKQLAALHDTVTGAFGGDITTFGSNMATVAGSGLLSANVVTTLQDQIGQYRSE